MLIFLHKHLNLSKKVFHLATGINPGMLKPQIIIWGVHILQNPFTMSTVPYIIKNFILTATPPSTHTMYPPQSMKPIDAYAHISSVNYNPSTINYNNITTSLDSSHKLSTSESLILCRFTPQIYYINQIVMNHQHFIIQHRCLATELSPAQLSSNFGNCCINYIDF